MFFSPHVLTAQGVHYALVSALLIATADIGKRYLMQRTNSVALVMLTRSAAQFAVFAVWVYLEAVPFKDLDASFFASCVILALFNTLASWLYLSALKVCVKENVYWALA